MRSSREQGGIKMAGSFCDDDARRRAPGQRAQERKRQKNAIQAARRLVCVCAPAAAGLSGGGKRQEASSISHTRTNFWSDKRIRTMFGAREARHDEPCMCGNAAAINCPARAPRASASAGRRIRKPALILSRRPLSTPPSFPPQQRYRSACKEVVEVRQSDVAALCRSMWFERKPRFWTRRQEGGAFFLSAPPAHPQCPGQQPHVATTSSIVSSSRGASALAPSGERWTAPRPAKPGNALPCGRRRACVFSIEVGCVWRFWLKVSADTARG